MYAEFIEQFHGYPQVVLAPEKPGPADGVVMVTPLHLDVDAGKYTITPTVDANVKLGKMTPLQAEQWGNVLEAAALIAQHVDAGWFSNDAIKASDKLWDRVDDLMHVKV